MPEPLLFLAILPQRRVEAFTTDPLLFRFQLSL
jgi:hypothetical protein